MDEPRYAKLVGVIGGVCAETVVRGNPLSSSDGTLTLSELGSDTQHRVSRLGKPTSVNAITRSPVGLRLGRYSV